MFWHDGAGTLVNKTSWSIRGCWPDGLPSAVLTFITKGVPVCAGFASGSLGRKEGETLKGSFQPLFSRVSRRNNTLSIVVRQAGPVSFELKPKRSPGLACSRFVGSRFHLFGHLLNSCFGSLPSTDTRNSAPSASSICPSPSTASSFTFWRHTGCRASICRVRHLISPGDAFSPRQRRFLSWDPACSLHALNPPRCSFQPRTSILAIRF